MVTAAQMRELALALPGAEERSHFGNPDFRVNGKIFAGLDADGKRGNLKLTLDTQDIVLSARPRAFTPAAGAWGRSGWTYVILAEATRPEVARLLEEAHTLVSRPRRSAAPLAAGLKSSRQPERQAPTPRKRTR